MASILEKGSLFPEHLVTDLFNKVKGKSSLAAMCEATPVPFNGLREFTFSMDKDVDIVAESGAKSNGGVTLEPVSIVPVKFEYGHRISNEFMYASEEEQLDTLREFNDGFARKLARGFDLSAMHGVNPRTGLAATSTVNGNCFDDKVTNIIQGESFTADEAVEEIIALIQNNDYDISGIILSPYLRTELSKMLANGMKLYPELAWGAAPSVINGLPASVNSTVSAYNNDNAIVGDFANAFRWGYARDVEVEIIEYGNPDNDTESGDLKGHNQVYVRAEAYIGWGILDPASFAILQGTVKAQDTSDSGDEDDPANTSVKTASAKASK